MLVDQSELGEKRDFLRMTVDCKVSFTELESGTSSEGRALNLSGRGVLFRSDKELKLGSQLDLHVIPDGSAVPPLNAKVEVVRVEMMEAEKSYEIGALILEMR
ncbi:hypothetical protein BOW53_03540 [Solemya pervernicosa gill symbiont]|uniref:PilZ domain-containing protein n=2 Tax=Gammaproteobacteria incertae sedis TaxID=118884 RepID=A0A1T2L8N5_9GAMM|nr:PilZ domain-containing protein [Candidatus Reidiella endopervernicosa]OOZ41459.1 hypothetical protein BOW53_03540 [Solemya pervernicosa gill symbiont]QKQ27346.1 PilZ domain-containing protein [Candidatus Reidiella endopervernicosa]